MHNFLHEEIGKGLRSMRLNRGVAFVGISAVVLLLSCATAPTNNPYDFSNTAITMLARSSTGIISASGVTDTTGDTIKIGIKCNLWMNLDSVQFRQVVSTSSSFKDSILGVKAGVSEFHSYDTIWQSAVFNEMGTKAVSAMAFLKNGHVVSDTISLSIYPRPVPNHPPVWQKDTINIVGSQGIPISITLTDKCSDPDHDSLSFSLLSGLPTGDTIANPTTNPAYTFTPGATDTGMFYPHIVAKDSKGAGDTLTIALSIHAPIIDTLPPLITLINPVKDTIISNDSCMVRVKCADASGITSVIFTLGTQTITATKSTSTDSIYSAIVKGLPAGVFSTVTVVATDASPALNKDSMSVRIKYDNDKTSPGIRLLSPAKDSASVAGNATMVQVICKDASGIASVTCTMGAASFPVNKSTSADSIWSATITGLAPGQFSILTIVAVDSSLAANKDTFALRIKYDNDTLAPTITRLDPAKDSMSVNSNSYAIKVVCKDPGGVASVIYTLGSASFPAIKSSDTIWSATVNGITPAVFSKITVIASDASLRANKDTMTFSIKYDSTITDLVGPIFYQKSGPANNTIVSDSIVTIIDSIYDPCGVDSVYWTLNGKNPKPLTLVSGKTNQYSLTDTLRRFHLDTIVISAQDKSTNRNKSNQTIVLNYNVPPVINDTNVSTNRNTAKTWTLNSQSIDGDPLTWSRLTSPSALSGTINGTLPNLIFTPAANWAGADSFLVRVTDGYWSDTAKVKITVIDVPVAPTITTQPAGATKNVGQTVTFSVGINADANPTPTYQWKHNGTAITSANQASFTIGSIAIADSGSYTVTVTNSAGTVTSSAATLTVNFAPTITTQPVSQVLYLGKSVTFSVVATGNPAPSYQWEKNGTQISGATRSTYSIGTPAIGDSGKYTVSISNTLKTIYSDTALFYAKAKSIAAGGSHSLILKTDGSLFACGLNNSGQLGDSTGIDRHVPKFIMSGVQSIAAGFIHSLILKTDGTLFACGDNSYGQLGDGTTTNRQYPIQIMSNVQNIAAGKYHSLILLKTSMLLGCGANFYGQLGDGTGVDQNTAIQIKAGVQSMAAGAFYTLILKTDGSLYACGTNDYGQLGNGTTTNLPTPTQVATDVQSIVAGYHHSMIIKTGGALFICGSNSNGQLGDGTIIDKNTFTPVTTGIQSCIAGEDFSFYLKTDGILFACGLNNFGQIGEGSTMEHHSFIQILTAVQSVTTGEDFSFIFKSDGTLLGCGNNAYGQLGNGTTTGAIIPIELKY